MEAEEESDEEIDEFYPSISDNIRTGHYRTDKASQTIKTEIPDLKKVQDVLMVLLKDLFDLKKNLYHTKTTLKAEYYGQLKDAILDLQNDVSQKVKELESSQCEKIEVLRRSYKVQLANALRKLSQEYHTFYGNIDAATRDMQRKKLKQLEHEQEILKRNMQAKREIVIEIPEPKTSTVSISAFADEIEALKKTVSESENRAECLEGLLEETNSEYHSLTTELENMMNELSCEKTKVIDLEKKNLNLQKQIKMIEIESNEKLAKQKEELSTEMQEKLDYMHLGMEEEARKQMHEFQDQEKRIAQIKQREAQKIKELQMKHAQEKNVPPPPVLETDVSRLQAIGKTQLAEILKLRKELKTLRKLYNLKVKILEENIHAVKNEMFLRSNFQRQTVDYRQSTVSYINEGLKSVSLGVEPLKKVKETVMRKLCLPSIIRVKSMPQEFSEVKSNIEIPEVEKPVN